MAAREGEAIRNTNETSASINGLFDVVEDV